MKNTLTKGMIALAGVGMLAGGAVTAFAAPEDGQRERRGNRSDARQEFNETLSDEQQEYLKNTHAEVKEGNMTKEEAKAEVQAYMEAEGIETPEKPEKNEKRAAFRDSLSEEDQAVMEEIRTQAEEEDLSKEEIQELIAEAGIEVPEKAGMNKENRKAIQEAIKTGDFQTFSDLTEDAPNGVQLTEDQFNGLQEVKDFKDAGDYESAKELAAELGLKMGKKKAFNAYKETLTEEQQDLMTEIKEAMDAGEIDGAAAKEKLNAAGIDLPKKKSIFKRIGGWFKKSADTDEA